MVRHRSVTSNNAAHDGNHTPVLAVTTAEATEHNTSVCNGEHADRQDRDKTERPLHRTETSSTVNHPSWAVMTRTVPGMGLHEPRRHHQDPSEPATRDKGSVFIRPQAFFLAYFTHLVSDPSLSLEL